MAVSGITFVLKTGDSNFLFTKSGGGGSDTFKVNINGVESGTIVESDTAATFETVLEAMSNIVSGDVVVTGSGGGPWTVEFLQNFKGLYPNISIVDPTGGLSVAIADAPTPLTNIRTLAAGRSDSLSRTSDSADVTTKDDGGWHVDLPTIRNWSMEFDHMFIEADSALADIELAFENNSQLQVRIQTPGGTTYTGACTLSDLSFEGPHDDLVTASGSLTGSGALTKV